MNQSRILFFIPDHCVRTDGVVFSQVVGLSLYLRKQGAEIMILSGDNEEDKAKEYAYNMLVKGINICHYPLSSGQIPMFSKISTASSLIRKLEKLIISFRPTHVYYRSSIMQFGARTICKQTKALEIFSLRGLSDEEALLKKGLSKYFYALALWFLQMLAIKRADSVNTVSNNMNQLVKSKYKRDSIVVPCCVGEDYYEYNLSRRKEIREKLLLATEHILFCYSGSLNPWQCVDETINLCKMISDRFPLARFLFLTNDQENMRNRLSQCGLHKSKSLVKRCAPYEVRSYLQAADVGIILRRDSVVNTVASPIKVAEYLASGLPVLISPNVGDYSDLIEKERCGLIIGLEQYDIIINFLQHNSREDLRSRAISTANRYCRWESWHLSIANLFGLQCKEERRASPD